MDRKILEPHHAVEKRDLYRSVLPIYTVDRASLQRHPESRIRGPGRHIFTIGMRCATYDCFVCPVFCPLRAGPPPLQRVTCARAGNHGDDVYLSASAGGCCLLTLLDKSTVNVRDFENLCGNHM